MARHRNPIPTYRGKNGRGIITVRDAAGNRRDILLPGPYDSEESRAEYERQLAILRTNRGSLPTSKENAGDPTVAELMVKYIEQHVDGYYPGHERENIRYALRPLNRLFAPLPAREFGPLNLRTLRDAVLIGSWMTDEEKVKYAKHGHTPGLARTTCNRNIGRIKAMFRWAVEMQLIPPSVLHGLQAVQGLRKGRSGARETAPVMPVDPTIVEDTLPHLPPVVRDMVTLQLLTSMRAGEVCAIKGVEIDRSGEVWVYSPMKHKTANLGHHRNIALGPKAQLILRRYLKADPDALLFSPAEQDRLIKEKKRADRKTPLYPSHVKHMEKKRKAKPKRRPQDHFEVRDYNRAIARACKKSGIPAWHTHQLRHTAALNVLREFGLEAARSALGHKTVNMTLHYSGIDLECAKEVASKIG